MNFSKVNSSILSAGDEMDGIQLTWKIENFSYMKNYRSLISPSFALNMYEWDIQMCNTKGDISLSMRNLKRQKYRCSWSCAVLDCDGMPLIWEEELKTEFHLCIHSRLFASIDKLISKKKKFLPNDTLTIQCHLWRSDKGLFTPVLRFARTKISPTPKLIKKSITWDVPDISSFEISKTLERKETITEEESISIKLRFEDYIDAFRFDIIASFIKDPEEIEIAVLDASKKEFVFPNNNWDELRFEYHKVYFSRTITRNMLRCYSNKFLPEDTLSLKFTFIFFDNVVFNGMVDEIENIPQSDAPVRGTSEAAVIPDRPEINQSTAPQSPNLQALQDMIDDGFPSDFDLRAGSRVFHVHRSVLGRKSRVFRAIITAEIKEKGKNVLDVDDMDEDTLQRLLQFVYSDEFDENMGWEKASSLYAAANKYALETLKQGCSATLKSKLDDENALRVLTLADKHQDQGLKSAALDYIFFHDYIIKEKNWTTFKEENGELAYATLLTLYFKKMNQY